jgi:sugar lactone lactonase YvrE
LGKLKVLVEGIGFPEALRWHDGQLWFSDHVSRAVLSLDGQGKLTKRRFIPGQPSGLGFLPDGSFLVVSMMDSLLVRVSSTGASILARLGDVVVGHANDLVVDARGRSYVSATGFHFYDGHEHPPPSPLAFVEPTGKARAITAGLMGANGMQLTPDGSTLIIAETFARRLTAFDVAPDGTLSKQRVFAELRGGLPDGICIDSSGAVWVASGSCFSRVKEGGEVIEAVETPGRWAVDCALGGPDMTTLYCGTSVTDLDRHIRGEDRGAIEAVMVSTPGF